MLYRYAVAWVWDDHTGKLRRLVHRAVLRAWFSRLAGTITAAFLRAFSILISCVAPYYLLLHYHHHRATLAITYRLPAYHLRQHTWAFLLVA